MSCDRHCSVALPHGAMGWSTVCYCSISWSYSLAFFSFLYRIVSGNKDKMCYKIISTYALSICKLLASF